MRFFKLFILVPAFVSLVACGSKGISPDDAMQDAIDSYKDFAELLASAEIQPCLPPGTQTTCGCPGGGSFAIDQANGTVTLDNCKSAGGKTYTGQITTTDDWQTIETDMTVFGLCSDVIGTANVDGCSGNMSMECPEWGFDCQIIDDSSSPGECTLSC